MPDPLKSRIQVFDPQQGVTIFVRRLPHWAQAGTVCFITWRTWDSIPETVLRSWLDERNAWLRQHGISPADPHWRDHLGRLPQNLVNGFRFRMSDRWNEHLDDCHGDCVLRNPQLAQVVADSLRRFDGDRYDLTDFVVMPNHVHVLVAFPDEDAMLAQCESWKRYMATSLNRLLGRRGRFWQQDAFDHLVRTVEQFDYQRHYIAANPQRARLRDGEFLHFSKPL